MRILLIFGMLLCGFPATAQMSYTVTNTDDAGTGSLRDAVDLANADGVSSMIGFDAALAGMTITLNSQITLSEDSTTINGDIDSDGAPDIGLSGVSGDGIRIDSDNNRIQGLTIEGFVDGLDIRGGSNVVFRNIIRENVSGVRLGPGFAAVTTTISQNSITRNSSGGITGANRPTPMVTLVISDETLAGLTDPGQAIEVFSDSGDQGANYLGSVLSNDDGTFVFDLTGIETAGLNINVTATDSAGGTSRFIAGGFEQIQISGNNWNLFNTNYGSWGFDVSSGQAGGEFPAGSNNFLVFAGGLWVGTIKDSTAVDPSLRYSVSSFEFSGEFGPGEIVNENVSFDQLSPGTISGKPVFVIDQTRSGIFYDYWPAAFGAPLDASGNPLLISDVDSWSVFNDVDLTNHNFFQSPVAGIGVEVQQQMYQFSAATLPGAENTTFIRLRIVNKTSTTYSGTYVGIWTDPDVGVASNDQIGTDTVRNMTYVYNDADESTTTGQQYAVGFKLIYFSGGGGVNARISNSTHFLNGVDPFDPQSDVQRYYYLQGLDQDGTIRLASEGFVETDGSPFVFPGDPVTGTGLISSSSIPGGRDLRSLVDLGPFDFEPSTPLDIIFAVIGGEGPTRNDAILQLRAEADAIQTGFASAVLPQLNTDNQPPMITLGVLQNPEPSLSGYLDVYLASNEPLGVRDAEFTYNQTTADFNFDFLTGSDNVYFANFDLDSSGSLSFHLDVRDLNGNRSTVDKLFSVAKIVAGKAGFAESSDRQLEIRFPVGFESTDLFVLIGKEETIVPRELTPLSAAYSVGPEKYENEREFRISIAAVLDQLDPSELDGVSIYRLEGTEWRRLGGSIFDGRVELSAGSFGTFRVFLDKTAIVPDRFALNQNYPNPFNPSTNIRYEIPVDTRVSLAVYNVLGQKVRDLVGAVQPAGVYHVNWDGKNNAESHVSSGVYIYRLSTKDFVKTRKMMLIR